MNYIQADGVLFRYWLVMSVSCFLGARAVCASCGESSCENSAAIFPVSLSCFRIRQLCIVLPPCCSVSYHQHCSLCCHLWTSSGLIRDCLHGSWTWIGLCSVLRPRLYGRRFLQVKRPNQQYQSTEGESCKGKKPQNSKKTQITHMHTHTK